MVVIDVPLVISPVEPGVSIGAGFVLTIGEGDNDGAVASVTVLFSCVLNVNSCCVDPKNILRY